MGKYQDALDNIKYIINIIGARKFNKDLKLLQELINHQQSQEVSARQQAIEILEDTMLYGEFYYEMEDWLTKCLCGNKTELPYGMESEYLKCALRIKIREYFKEHSATYNDEDIENVLDRLSSDYVLDLYYIEPKIHDYLIERNNISMEDLDV